MSSAAIPLAVQTPQIQSPLQTIGGLMQIRSALTEQALRQAQIQQANQQTQLIQAEQTQRNKDVADQNTLQEIEKDPDAFAKIYSGDMTPLIGKVQPKTVENVITNVNDAISKKAAATKAQLDNELTAHQQIGQTLDSLSQMRAADGTLDIDQVNAQLPGVIQRLAPELKVLGVDPSQLPKSIASEDDLKGIAARSGAMAALTQAAIARQKSQAEAQEAAGKGAEGKANARKANLASDILAQAMSGISGSQMHDPVGSIMSPDNPALAAFRNEYASTKPSAGDNPMQPFNEVLQRAAQNEADYRALRDKGTIQATANKEAVVAGARANAEIPARVDEAVQTQLALAKNSPDAFAGITDRTARTAAETNYEKDSKDYADKVGASKQLNDFVAAAQSGNKAAPGLIPITEVRQLVNRVNRNELESVSAAAGSAYDRLQGFFGKYTEGQPIPPAVLNDVKAISNTMENAARRTYVDRVAVTNKTYGSKVQPIDLPSNQKTATMAQINAYAAAHKITVDAARKQAESEGYAVQ